MIGANPVCQLMKRDGRSSVWFRKKLPLWDLAREGWGRRAITIGLHEFYKTFNWFGENKMEGIFALARTQYEGGQVNPACEAYWNE